MTASPRLRHLRHAVALIPVLAAVMLGSCKGDAVGPSHPSRNLSLELTGSASGGSTQIDMHGAHITCDVELFAVATGERGAVAPWSGATFRFAFGADRTVFTDSIRVGAAEVRSAWGTEGPAAGETATSRWSARGGLPFTLQLEFRYLTGIDNSPVPTRVEVDCGPRPAGGATSGPGVSEIQMTPAPGSDLEVGDSVRVSYSAGAEAGLWVTGLEFAGASQHVVQRLGSYATSASETIAVATLQNATLDTLEVRVFAVDILGRIYRSAPGRVRLVDTRPPTIFSVQLISDVSRQNGAALAAVDTLRLNVVAYDSHRLDRLVYRLEGAASYQDSVAVRPQMTQNYLLPMREEWIGESTLTITAVDAAGNRAEWKSEPGGVQVYPLVRPLLRSLDLEAAHGDVVMDRASERLLLALPGADRVEKVSLPTLEATPLATFPGRRPMSADLTPDEGRIVVALAGDSSLAVVDAASGAMLRTVNLTPGVIVRPRLVRATTGGRAVVLGDGPLRVRLVEVDLESGALKLLLDVPGSVGTWPSAVRSSDGSVVSFHFGSCAIQYDAASGAVSPCRSVQPGGLLTANSGATLHGKGSTVYTSDLSPVRDFGGGVTMSGVSHDGAEFFMRSLKGILRIRVNDGRIVERSEAPYLWNGRFLTTAGGSFLIGVGEGSPAAGPTRITLAEID